MQCKVTVFAEYDFYLMYKQNAESLSSSLSVQDSCIAKNYNSISDIYYWNKEFKMIWNILMEECKRSKYRFEKSEILEKLMQLCIRQNCINLEQFRKIRGPFVEIIECNRKIFEVKEEIKYLDKIISAAIEDAVYSIKNSKNDIARAKLERERLDEFLTFHKNNKFKCFKLINSAIRKFLKKDDELVAGLNFLDASTAAENNMNILKSLVNEIGFKKN